MADAGPARSAAVDALAGDGVGCCVAGAACRRSASGLAGRGCPSLHRAFGFLAAGDEHHGPGRRRHASVACHRHGRRHLGAAQQDRRQAGSAQPGRHANHADLCLPYPFAGAVRLRPGGRLDRQRDLCLPAHGSQRKTGSCASTGRDRRGRAYFRQIGLPTALLGRSAGRHGAGQDSASIRPSWRHSRWWSSPLSSAASTTSAGRS